MSEHITFPSWAEPNVKAYTWYKSFYDAPFYAQAKRCRAVADQAGFFLTYGDGMVQHSHESTVTVEYWVDYFASLARWLKDRAALAREAEVAILAHGWPEDWPVGKIEFAAKIEHKEGPSQFYSKSGEKTSYAESKRHDNRWEQVPEWANGSLQSAYRILVAEWHNPLQQFRIADQVADYFNRDGFRYNRRDVLNCCGVTNETDSNRDAHLYVSAYYAVDWFVRAYRATQEAYSSVSCLENNYGKNYLDRAVKASETA